MGRKIILLISFMLFSMYLFAFEGLEQAKAGNTTAYLVMQQYAGGGSSSSGAGSGPSGSSQGSGNSGGQSSSGGSGTGGAQQGTPSGYPSGTPSGQPSGQGSSSSGSQGSSDQYLTESQKEAQDEKLAALEKAQKEAEQAAKEKAAAEAEAARAYELAAEKQRLEQLKAQEEARKAEEERKIAEAIKQAEEARIAAQKAEEERLAREAEQRRLEEERRVAYLEAMGLDTRRSSEGIAQKEMDWEAYKKEQSAITINNSFTVKEFKQIGLSATLGDPVRVTTGEYIQDAVDFVKPIEIIRHYGSNSTLTGCFGYGWFSNIDERLIFCVDENYNQKASKFRSLVLDAITYDKKTLTQKYGDSPYGKCTYIDDLNEKETQAKAEYDSLIAKAKIQDAILSQNAMLKNIPTSYVFAGQGNIVQITENGSPCLFKKVNESLWQEENSYSTIVLNSNGTYTLSNKDEKRIYQNNGLISEIRTKTGWTTYIRKDGNLVREICNSNNEALELSYNGNYITKIVNQRDKTHSSEYTYNGNFLTEYIDWEKDKTTYTYDSKGKLSKVIKADGSFLEFRYNLEDKSGNLLTTSTHNEEGQTEYFSYDRQNRKTTYTDYNGNITEITYDNDFRITEQKSGGSTIRFKWNNKNELLEETINGITTLYTYDSNGNVTQKTTGGKTETFTYDSNQNLISYKDSTGATFKYSYDTNGFETSVTKNGILLFEKEHDINGKLLKEKIHGPSVYEITYKYDMYGNPVEKRMNNIVEKRSYDSQNRIISCSQNGITLKQYEYDTHYVKINEYPALTKEFFYNSRKDNIKKSETDTLHGKTRTVTFIYDKRHNPVKAAYIENDSEKTFWEKRYDKNGKTEAKLYYGKDYHILYVYDLVSQEDIVTGVYKISVPVSNFQNISLLKLKAMADEQIILQSPKTSETNNSKTDYTYYSDGKTKSSTFNNITTDYSYDDYGRLTKMSNPMQDIVLEYDHFNRVKKASWGKGNIIDQTKSFDYDDKKMTVKVTLGDEIFKTYEFDSFGNILKETDANGNTSHYEYNFTNDITMTLDPYGNVTEYEYDGFSHLTKIKTAENDILTFSYDLNGNITESARNKSVCFTASYDKNGNTIEEYKKPEIILKTTYDSLGRIISVKKGETVTERYEYSPEGFDFFDGNNNRYSFNLDSQDHIVSETNRLGSKKSYSYDKYGLLSSISDFDGSTKTYSTSKDFKTTQIISDSETVLFERNSIGKPVHVKNPLADLYFSYNRAGLLTEQFDKVTNESVQFEYDKSGNRTKLLSSSREIHYEYGKQNEITRLTDVKNRLSVAFSYDKTGKETKRSWSNGISRTTKYDSLDRASLIYETDYRGQVIWAEGYIYDNNGKLKATIQKNGSITVYDYDKNGHLASVKYPWNTSYCKTLKEMAELHGYSVPSENDFLENYTISLSLLTELRTLMSQLPGNILYSIPPTQVCIPVQYEYDKNENLSVIKTRLSRIDYHYDAENRIISTTGRKTGTEFSYDDNGNLISQKSPLKVKSFRYDNNKLVSSEVTDYKSNTHINTDYGYDGFGRRILARDNSGEIMHYIYAGCGFELIKEGPIGENSLFSDYFSSGNSFESSFSKSSENSRYRYIGPENNNAVKSYKDITPDNLKTTSPRDTKITEYLSFGNNIYALKNGSETFILGTDTHQSTRSLISFSGNNFTFEYDVYGNLMSEFSLESSFPAFCGHMYDKGNGFANYGFRDYNPYTASFTSLDPARDGTNWYSLSKGDSVNFVDHQGLINISVESNYIMNNGNYWDEVRLNQDNCKISNSGCALMTITNIDAAINELNIGMNVSYVLENNRNFVKDGNVQWSVFASANNMENQRLSSDGNVGIKKDFTVSDYESQKNDYENLYFTAIQAVYDTDNHKHWVTAKGTTEVNGKKYFVVSGTSKNDLSEISNRKGAGWLWVDGEILVPEEKVTGASVFKMNICDK